MDSIFSNPNLSKVYSDKPNSFQQERILPTVSTLSKAADDKFIARAVEIIFSQSAVHKCDKTK